MVSLVITHHQSISFMLKELKTAFQQNMEVFLATRQKLATLHFSDNL